MATITFSAVGGALGGPVGAWIGSAIGSYVDSMILSKLNPKPEAKIGDIKLGTAEEGAPIIMVMGPEVRSGLEVIWKSEVRPVRHGGGGGGCGGEGEPEHYTYSADFCVAIGQPPPGSVVERVDKIFFDGKVAWSYDPDITITSNLLSVLQFQHNERSSYIEAIANNLGVPVVITTVGFIGPFFTGSRVAISGVTGATNVNGTWTVTTFSGRTITISVNGSGAAWTGGGVVSTISVNDEITSPNGGPDLSVFRAGFNIVISGFANAANNGSFPCRSSRMDPATGISYLIVGNDNCIAEAAGASVTLFQDLPQFSARYYSAVEFHNGSQWQLPDSLIEAVEGVGNVSGHRGIANLTFESLDMSSFGDRLPNVNTLSRVSSTWTVGQAIAACVARAGLEAADIDVSSLTGLCRGYYVVGAVTPASSLASIMTTFNVVGYQVNETLFFVYRKDIVPTVITSTELVAHAPGAEAPRRTRVRPIVDRDIPREVQVHYQNPNRDHQGGMESAKRSGTSGDMVEQFDTNITLSPGPAQDLARRLLWTGLANRHILEIRLPPSRMQIHEGQVLQFTEQGRVWNLLAQKIDYQHDGAIIVEGPNDEAAALDFTGSPADGGADDSGGPGVLQSLDLHVIDIAPLSDSHLSNPGVYVVSAPVDQTHLWIGARLFESTQNVDGTFTPSVSIPTAARLGLTLSVLANATPFMIDYVSTVDVILTFGEGLESVTEAAMLAGDNRAIVGQEVIGYTTATLIGTYTWRLSGLLRGLRDTDQVMGLHGANERFISIRPQVGLFFVPQSIGLLESTRYYRSVPIGGNVDDYPTDGEQYDANTVRPFTVFDVRGNRLASDATPDVVVTWTRQTRTNILGILTTAPIPLNESRELYEIDLMDKPTGGVAVLTKQVTTATATFTDAEITGLGYTSGDLIKVRVYQIGDFVGRGRMRAATI